jgi:uncharacterized protein (TIGR02271 family)
MVTKNDENRAPEPGEVVLPLLGEEVEVSKQRIETGRVQVARVTREREQLIDEVLAREAVEIERTAIGRPVEAMPAVREEGDTIVVPIVEEVLVVERRLMLKEEVRIRRVRSTQRHQERVTLRHQEAVVTRVRAEQPGDGERAGGGAEASERPGADGRVIPPSSPRS